MTEQIAVSTIRVQLPDGSIREVPSGTTPLEIATSISPRLAAVVVVAKVKPMAGLDINQSEGGQDDAPDAGSEEAMYDAALSPSAERIIDLAMPLAEDVELWLLKEQDEESLKVLRHSTAHVMATAILELFPETKLGHGPATDAGFFYDVYRETPFTEDDLAAIEKRMGEVVARNDAFVKETEPREDALQEYAAEGEFMKVHFIERFTQAGEPVSLYRNGGFTDFCRGPHVPSTGRVKAFKVTSVAGAYWLGDEKNQQLQRIYGTAFFNAKDMDAHFKRLEEIKARDHRVLGKQLDLFSIQEVAGAGLIFWHPKGGLIRKAMEDWMREDCIKRGYEMVFTPHIMRRELWKISGHEENYGENMYPPMELDDAEYRLKPMNCPGHILIYKNSPKSYRDLPVRYAELGNVYRYERSGTMHGLLRVRGFTQDDAHIFCTPGQIEDEVTACIEFAESVLNTFGFHEFKVELSTWDPNDKKFIGSAEQWGVAVGSLRNALERKGIPYKTIPGEAAFYGPKIDIKLVDVLGRMWQLSTVQFDWNLPARFDLHYKGEDGELHQPVMVHRALFGSVERFFGVLIEHYAGAFPFWLAPVQVGLVPISEKHLEYARTVQQRLKDAGVRVELDERNEKMNAKIREFGVNKVPFILIMGDKESQSDEVSVRTRGKGDGGAMSTEAFVARCLELQKSHSAEL
ncbi:threonine--tRNA ligase [Granulicella tundricola]|uniref:Threonine--tRNA ligase n=1 Tax=Granulicella tundricola (strain ATCC BAA-1859 / DSM 23138 / MP5ACTX9) TaxID=1198114 RepID=E8WWN7_GRATM|nr:threonine--tRNA ligase [Granulicella tundricola]ADW70782.1 threonyl-tRNA synthetase [Granulicella tundricola MP5ACTX9]